MPPTTKLAAITAAVPSVIVAAWQLLRWRSRARVKGEPCRPVAEAESEPAAPPVEEVAVPDPQPEASLPVARGEEPDAPAPSIAAVEEEPPAPPAVVAPVPSAARLAAEATVAEGRLSVEARRLDEAAVAFRRAVKTDPTLPAAWHQLGLVHALQGKLGKAVTELGEAVHLDPSPEIRQDLEEVQAMRRYVKMLTHNPANAEAHLRLGLIYFVREMGDQALAEFRQAVRLRPDLSDAHLYLGLEYHFRGELARAEGQYREAIRLKPDNSLAHEHLALLRRYPGGFETMESPEEATSPVRALARGLVERLDLP